MQYATSNQKLKLISMIDLLKKYSDEEHPLSAPELIKLLKARGINCERKYIYSVIESLIDYGFDINRTYKPKQGFYLGQREFELAEIKILIDAVASAPFITLKKSKELVKKLQSQLSIYQSCAVDRGISLGNKTKVANEEIYYTINNINEAICSNRKIKFTYYHTIIKDNRIVSDEGKEFLVSPYALIWSNDRYYLVCNYSKYNNISHYRVDRIKKVVITDEVSRSCSEVSPYKSNEDFDIADYMKKAFGMFGGEEESVELICDNSLLEVIADRFGSDIKIQKYSSQQFKVCFSIFMNKTLISWLVDNADKVYVKSPAKLRGLVKDKILNIYNAYFKNNVSDF